MFAETIADLRLREAFACHRAWLSVDALGPVRGSEERLAAYRTIGKLMSELAGGDCLAIYCPELQRCNEFDKTVVETLRSENPLALFENPTFAPIVAVDGDDPRIVKAVEEARRRWPEFVAQFQAKCDGDRLFLIKAEFQDADKSEFMWVAVSRIGDTEVHGVLENSPRALKSVREGEPVVVPLSALNDWLYAAGNKSGGGFTIKAIQEIEETK